MKVELKVKLYGSFGMTLKSLFFTVEVSSCQHNTRAFCYNKILFFNHKLLFASYLKKPQDAFVKNSHFTS